MESLLRMPVAMSESFVTEWNVKGESEQLCGIFLNGLGIFKLFSNALISTIIWFVLSRRGSKKEMVYSWPSSFNKELPPPSTTTTMSRPAHPRQAPPPPSRSPMNGHHRNSNGHQTHNYSNVPPSNKINGQSHSNSHLHRNENGSRLYANTGGY